MVIARLLVVAILAAPAEAGEDPFGSLMWEHRRAEMLGAAPVVFDPRVVVHGPAHAEDPFQVPLLVDARGLREAVERIVVFADYGPIPRILTFHPGAAEPALSLRFKIDQATPVRAAALTTSGTWHVGSTWIDAAGGGCSAPAAAYASDDWEDRLGTVLGRIWPASGRVRARIDHPMDTGLADGIPVFIVTELDFAAPDGTLLTRIEPDEPVSEDPVFTLHFAAGALPEEVILSGRDNGGNRFAARLRAEPSQ